MKRQRDIFNELIIDPLLRVLWPPQGCVSVDFGVFAFLVMLSARWRLPE